MNLEKLRSICLKFPHATEDVQWENDLLFRVGGKIFAGVSLIPPHHFSFKCAPEEFAELTQIEGIIPAPYVARYKWVQIQDDDALRLKEIERLLAQSYQLVYDKLPPKIKKTFLDKHEVTKTRRIHEKKV